MPFSDPHDFMGVPDGVSLDALHIAYVKRKKELLNSNPVSMEALKDLDLAYQILQYEYGEEEEEESDEENTLTEEEQRIIDNSQLDEDELEEVVAHANSVDSEEDAEDSTYQDEEEILSEQELPESSEELFTSQEDADYFTLNKKYNELLQLRDKKLKEKQLLSSQYQEKTNQETSDEYIRFMSTFRIDVASNNGDLYGFGEKRINLLHKNAVISALHVLNKWDDIWEINLGEQHQRTLREWALDIKKNKFPRNRIIAEIREKLETEFNRIDHEFDKEIFQINSRLESIKKSLSEAKHRRFLTVWKRICCVGALFVAVIFWAHSNSNNVSQPTLPVTSFPTAVNPVAVSAPVQIDKRTNESKAQVSSPGFDCNKASSPAEHLICANAELAALDNEMTVLYNNIYLERSDSEFDSILKDQRQFLQDRENACDNLQSNTEQTVSCMKELYRQRIARLESINNAGTSIQENMPVNGSTSFNTALPSNH